MADVGNGSKIALLAIAMLSAFLVRAVFASGSNGAGDGREGYILQLDSGEVAANFAAHPELIYFSLGNFLFSEGNYAMAAKSYGKGILINPSYAPLYHNKGVAQYFMEQPDASLGSFRSAVALDAGYAKAYTSMALVEYRLGKLDTAISSLEKAVMLSPEDFTAKNDLAVMLVESFRIREEEGTISQADVASLMKAGELFAEIYSHDSSNSQARVNAEVIGNVIENYT